METKPNANMTMIEYANLARRTINPDLAALDQLLNATLGLSGETGEIADHVKKHIYHNQPLNSDYLVKELGDLLWYINQMCEAIGTDLGLVAMTNIEKLMQRHPNGFDTSYHQKAHDNDQ